MKGALWRALLVARDQNAFGRRSLPRLRNLFLRYLAGPTVLGPLIIPRARLASHGHLLLFARWMYTAAALELNLGNITLFVEEAKSLCTASF